MFFYRWGRFQGHQTSDVITFFCFPMDDFPMGWINLLVIYWYLTNVFSQVFDDFVFQCLGLMLGEAADRATEEGPREPRIHRAVIRAPDHWVSAALVVSWILMQGWRLAD